MGMFGDSNSGEQDAARAETDALINQQFKQNQAEIQQKKSELFNQRLDIIKSQGGQVWKPKR
jgi:hypothetical protein